MNNEFDPVISEWRSYVDNPKLNLVEKCFKLAQILEYPNLDIEKEVQKINNIGISLKNSVVESKSHTYRISLLNEFLFQTCGFNGNMEDYYNPKNSNLKELGLIPTQLTYDSILDIAKYVIKYKKKFEHNPFEELN